MTYLAGDNRDRSKLVGGNVTSAIPGMAEEYRSQRRTQGRHLRAKACGMREMCSGAGDGDAAAGRSDPEKLELGRSREQGVSALRIQQGGLNALVTNKDRRSKSGWRSAAKGLHCFVCARGMAMTSEGECMA